MPTKIVKLYFYFQTPAGPRASRNIVRKSRADPQRQRIVEVNTDIETGPDSGANAMMRRFVLQTIEKRLAKGEEYFYVIAEFRKTDNSAHFKTIVPRTEIPIQFCRV